jgi:flagella basal body P-ring formation protein FlgA
MKLRAICLTLAIGAGVSASSIGVADVDAADWSMRELAQRGIAYLHMQLSKDIGTRSRISIEPISGTNDQALQWRPCTTAVRWTHTIVNAETGRVLVHAQCADGATWRVPLSMRVTTDADVYVSARELRVDEPIDAAAWRIERVQLAALPATLLSPPQDLAGLTPRRALRAGVVLRPSDLRPLPWIRRGDSVTVRVNGAGFELRTVAIALADARPGEELRLRNAQTGRALQGRATAPGVVTATVTAFGTAD